MKTMWVARYCRKDCLRTVHAVTAWVTKWTATDDNKLPRLMSYPSIDMQRLEGRIHRGRDERVKVNDSHRS